MAITQLTPMSFEQRQGSFRGECQRALTPSSAFVVQSLANSQAPSTFALVAIVSNKVDTWLSTQTLVPGCRTHPRAILLSSFGGAGALTYRQATEASFDQFDMSLTSLLAMQNTTADHELALAA
jgi:hypothetical protein